MGLDFEAIQFRGHVAGGAAAAEVRAAIYDSRVRWRAVSPVVKMSCTVNGQSAGTQNYSGTDEKYYEAELPAGVDSSKPMRFEFTVEHSWIPASMGGI